MAPNSFEASTMIFKVFCTTYDTTNQLPEAMALRVLIFIILRGKIAIMSSKQHQEQEAAKYRITIPVKAGTPGLFKIERISLFSHSKLLLHF